MGHEYRITFSEQFPLHEPLDRILRSTDRFSVFDGPRQAYVYRGEEADPTRMPDAEASIEANAVYFCDYGGAGSSVLAALSAELTSAFGETSVDDEVDESEFCRALFEEDGAARDINFGAPSWPGTWRLLERLTDDYKLVSAQDREGNDVALNGFDYSSFALSGDGLLSVILEKGELLDHLQVFISREPEGAPFVELTFFARDIVRARFSESVLLGWLRGLGFSVDASQIFLRVENASWEFGSTDEGTGVIWCSELGPRIQNLARGSALRTSVSSRIWGTENAWSRSANREGAEGQICRVELEIQGNKREGFHLVMSPEGFFTADSHHADLADALETANQTYGVFPFQWQESSEDGS